MNETLINMKPINAIIVQKVKFLEIKAAASKLLVGWMDGWLDGRLVAQQ